MTNTMSTAISPLAPAHVPEMPAIAGVKLATAAAGIRYKGRTDVLLAVLDAGHRGSRRLHQIKMPLRAGGMVPCRNSSAGRRARWW